MSLLWISSEASQVWMKNWLPCLEVRGVGKCKQALDRYYNNRFRWRQSDEEGMRETESQRDTLVLNVK